MQQEGLCWGEAVQLLKRTGLIDDLYHSSLITRQLYQEELYFDFQIPDFAQIKSKKHVNKSYSLDYQYHFY